MISYCDTHSFSLTLIRYILIQRVDLSVSNYTDMYRVQKKQTNYYKSQSHYTRI